MNDKEKLMLKLEYLKKLLVENKNEKEIEKELKEKYPNLYFKNYKDSNKKI